MTDAAQVGIPVISLDRFDAGGEARRALSAELGAAFREIGFVGIRGHGISDEVRDRAYESTRKVFELPVETKRRYVVPGSGGGRGYTAFGIEKAKDQDLADLKEFWHVGPEPSPRADMLPNQWPEEVPAFRQAMLDLYAALTRTGDRVLQLVAMHLGLEEERFVVHDRARLARFEGTNFSICYVGLDGAHLHLHKYILPSVVCVL